MATRRKYLRGAVVLSLVLLSALLPAAHAGQGPSTLCTDDSTAGGATEIPVLDTVVTLAVEVGGTPPYMQLCYSTTTEGDGNVAITGGEVHISLTNPPTATCNRDASPTVIGVDCTLRDDSAPSVGRTLEFTLWFQGQPTTIVGGIEAGAFGPPACLDNATVYTPVGNIGPFDIGVCPP